MAIDSLKFDNRNIKSLPVETKPGPIVSRQVPNAIFAIVEPTSCTAPQLMSFSEEALALLGLDPVTCGKSEASRKALAEYLSGNAIIPGSRPAAHCYCGHQFGSFAGQLGDGATMYLGEVIHPLTGQRWELQLKGTFVRS